MGQASCLDALDEGALARRIAGAGRAPESAAEAELYRRLAPRVRLYGLRHLRDPQAAADLVQQVLLMTLERLRAPLSGVQRLDVVQVRGGGEPDMRLADVPFDAQTDEVLVIPSPARLKTMAAFTMRMRLIAVGEAGESEIGEYTFLHSPG
jgi:RNA polymerase sigma-70 factor (ECF subfamily)